MSAAVRPRKPWEQAGSFDLGNHCLGFQALGGIRVNRRQGMPPWMSASLMLTSPVALDPSGAQGYSSVIPALRRPSKKEREAPARTIGEGLLSLAVLRAFWRR